VSDSAWRTDVLPFESRPYRQFILVEGFKEHSGVVWNRVWADVAFIRRDDQPDSILEYRAEDIERIRRDGDMDGVEKVLGWMPANFPDFNEFAAQSDAQPTSAILEKGRK
jgi:hypothetical protein